MPKSIYWLSLLTVFSSASYALAIDKYNDESEYKVYCVEPPPPHGFPYITLGIGSFKGEIDDITIVSPATDINLTEPNVSDTATQYFAGIGYQLAEYGIFNRFEIIYTKRGSIAYDPNPALNLAGLNDSLNSTVKNYTVMGKTYWDIYPIKFLVPYIQGGVGFSQNKVNSTGTTQLPPFNPVILTTEQTETSFAWDAGVGIRAAVTKYFFVDLGYEYDYLGTGLQWQVPSFSPSGPPLILESGSFHSNAYNLALTYNFR